MGSLKSIYSDSPSTSSGISSIQNSDSLQIDGKQKKHTADSVLSLMQIADEEKSILEEYLNLEIQRTKESKMKDNIRDLSCQSPFKDSDQIDREIENHFKYVTVRLKKLIVNLC